MLTIGNQVQYIATTPAVPSKFSGSGRLVCILIDTAQQLMHFESFLQEKTV